MIIGGVVASEIAERFGEDEAETGDAVEVPARVVVAVLGQLGQGDHDRVGRLVARFAHFDVVDGRTGDLADQLDVLRTPTVRPAASSGAEISGTLAKNGAS